MKWTTNAMANLSFAEQLEGDIRPVIALFNELVDSGVSIECVPDETELRAVNGSTIFSTYWHHDLRLWRVYFPAHTHAHRIYHELLHARFKGVYGAPVMRTTPLLDDEHKAHVAELNNDFDHAYVVPREVALYPIDAAAYWEATFGKYFDAIPRAPTNAGEVFQRKLLLARGWLVLPVALPCAPITQRFRAELKRSGWLDEAQTMTTRVQDAGPNKPAAVEAFRDYLKYDFPPAGQVFYLTPWQ